MLDVIDKRTGDKLSDRAYRYICQQMLQGRVVAGSRLSVGMLASEIGISRTPVSEALKRLELEHVVERVPRVGTIVRRPSVDEIGDLYDLREMLESYAAACSARRSNAEQVRQLGELLAQLRQLCVDLRNSEESYLTTKQTQRFLALDMAFHAIILQAVRTPHVRRIIEDTRVFTTIFCTRREDYYDLSVIAGVYLWHGRIYRAIRRGDDIVARKAMAEHLRVGREGALKYLRRHQGQEDSVDVDLKAYLPDGMRSLVDDEDEDSSR